MFDNIHPIQGLAGCIEPSSRISKGISIMTVQKHVLYILCNDRHNIPESSLRWYLRSLLHQFPAKLAGALGIFVQIGSTSASEYRVLFKGAEGDVIADDFSKLSACHVVAYLHPANAAI